MAGKDSEFTDPFKSFMSSEYQNISEAHFRTIAAISAFFRNYLLIMTLPVTLLGLFTGLSSRFDPVTIISTLGLPISITLGVISVVGYLVMLYMVNLRTDVILYAHTVNSIRKYFYDIGAINRIPKLRMRILPQTAFQPDYFEESYFLPVVLAFAAFNTFYMVASMVLFYLSITKIALTTVSLVSLPWWIWLGSLFLPIHVASYWLYARQRERGYLRSLAIGVDIDGVLNRHRDHFAFLLERNTRKIRFPVEFNIIPLHDDHALNVSRDNERAVFNDPEYWTEMPVFPEAPVWIDRIRNAFKLRIDIFTSRPWPTEDVPETVRASWRQHAIDMVNGTRIPPPRPFRRWKTAWRLYSSLNKVRLTIPFKPLSLRPIDAITKCWLYDRKIIFDRFTIERGSDYASYPGIQFKNRFYISRKESCVSLSMTTPKRRQSWPTYAISFSYSINHTTAVGVSRIMFCVFTLGKIFTEQSGFSHNLCP